MELLWKKDQLYMMTATIVVALVCCISLTESYEVNKIGNDVIPSAGGPDVTGGSAIFLLKDAFPEAGVLFAFSAYFRNRNPLQFQVWRPASNTSNDLTLLAELRIKPSVAESAELVYIVSQLTEDCVRVAAGDRLGLYFANTSSPLAQTFNRFDANPQILVHYVDGPPQPINVNDTLTFDHRIYPYDFSLTAFYYLESPTDEATPPTTTTTVDCPRNQLIDGDPKPSSPSTPIPTGIPGQAGVVGRPGLTGVRGINGLAGSTGYTGASGKIGPSGLAGFTGYTGATGNLGPSGYDGATGSVGQTGSTGATGFTGPEGPAGQTGLPGVVIYTNETDFNDTLGLPPRPQQQQQVLSSSDRQWRSEAYMQGILIWLAIVSLILVILIVVLTLFTTLYRLLNKEMEDISKRMNFFGMSSTLTTDLPSSIHNHGTVKSQRAFDVDEDLRDMREETFTNYEVDTMEKYATKKLRDLQDYDNDFNKQ